MQRLIDHLDRSTEGYEFEVDELAPSVRLHVQPSDRFKQVTTHVYQLNPLGPEAAERALIPLVLRSGCEGYPTRKAIAIRLQELFGASFSVRTSRFGHAHLQTYQLAYIADRYLDGDRSARDALDLLEDLLSRPVAPEKGAEGGTPTGFRPEYVQRERKQLLDTIDAQKENKSSYAVRRCEKLLFMDDPYRYGTYGERDRVAGLEAEPLYERYRSDRARSRFDVIVIGPTSVSSIRQQMRDGLLRRLPDRSPQPVEPVLEPAGNGEAMEVTETGDGEQSWLVMGYRTPVVMGHPDMYALSVTVGLLGGFPHSKLFRNVREKEGLVYSIRASLKRSVGLVLVTAGIDEENREKTTSAIQSCVKQLVDGDFSDEELRMTRRKLVEQIVDMEDNPAKKAGSYLNRHLIDRVEPLSRIAEQVRAVDRKEVRDAAEDLSLAITYCRR